MARRYAGALLLFAGSVALTIVWCGSMSGMPGMDMPGGWTMSMAWMRMPGQGWMQSAAAFIGMWAVMMVAMMLPVIAPAIATAVREYRRAVVPARADALTARFVAAYFGVWLLAGACLYPLGAAWAEWTMHDEALARAVPWLAGMTLVTAGLFQLGAWKPRMLARCHRVRPGPRAHPPRAGWHDGARLGLHCFACCAPLTAALLVLGVMDLAAMALCALAIALERRAPRGARFARLTGALLIAAGAASLVRAGLPG